MKNIIIIQGLTNSGKDTLATALTLWMPQWAKDLPMRLVNVKMVAAEKRQWEQQWGLPYGSLELREVKSMQMPGHPHGWTYARVMVHCAMEYENLGFKAKLIRRYSDDIAWYINNGFTPILTDLRFPNEVEVIRQLTMKYIDLKVHTFRVSRDEEVELAADTHLEENKIALDGLGRYVVELTKNSQPDTLARNVYQHLRVRIQPQSVKGMPPVPPVIES